MASRRDVEQDIRDRLVREARGYPHLIAKQQTIAWILEPLDGRRGPPR